MFRHVSTGLVHRTSLSQSSCTHPSTTILQSLRKQTGQAHRIGIGVIRRERGQSTSLLRPVVRHEYAGILAAKIRGERAQPGHERLGVPKGSPQEQQPVGNLIGRRQIWG